MDPAKIREALGLAPRLLGRGARRGPRRRRRHADRSGCRRSRGGGCPETNPAPAPAPAAPRLPSPRRRSPRASSPSTRRPSRVCRSPPPPASAPTSASASRDRDNAIMAAIQAGKIAPARRAHFEASWAADPEGTKSVLASLAPGLVPVAAFPGYAGETETGSGDDAYAASTAPLRRADIWPTTPPVFTGDSLPFTSTTSAAVTGGQVLIVTGSGTVGPAAAASGLVVGVAAHDAANGAQVTVWPPGVVHETVTPTGCTAGNALVLGCRWHRR